MGGWGTQGAVTGGSEGATDSTQDINNDSENPISEALFRKNTLELFSATLLQKTAFGKFRYYQQPWRRKEDG